jgi:tRNA U34 5-methylaminomethyl-2-thiouridine-forming methyltransferase MnmC
MEVLERTCSLLGTGGIFVTYSARGELKRSLKALGFEITLLRGAAGKREMLRAIKK